MKLYVTSAITTDHKTDAQMLSCGYVTAENKNEAIGKFYQIIKNKYPGRETEILVGEVDENTLKQITESMNAKKELT